MLYAAPLISEVEQKVESSTRKFSTAPFQTSKIPSDVLVKMGHDCSTDSLYCISLCDWQLQLQCDLASPIPFNITESANSLAGAMIGVP